MVELFKTTNFLSIDISDYLTHYFHNWKIVPIALTFCVFAKVEDKHDHKTHSAQNAGEI